MPTDFSASAVGNEPVIDEPTLDGLRALAPDDDSLVREVIAIYLDDTPQRITEIRHAHATGDLGTLVRAAHSVKGSSANMGTLRVRTAAAAIEHHGRSAGLAGTEPLIATLVAAYEEAEPALRALL